MAATDIAIPPLRPAADYQAFLDEGKFMLLKPRKGGAPFFYPRLAAPRTGDRDLEWVPASGRGTVYSVTIVSQKPPAPNHNVVLVDLEEGPRLMSRVIGIEPTAVRIGMAVKAKIEQVDGQGVLFFEPAE
ncbi:Zn-ribbon domain-containing OB-fold protein [Thauera sinica]|uniref:Zn-ribbon domain-containing OB-fold protein n=1 Tax=Thauera sinica TaxID=2665146 RepID=A0ABW1AXV1_9RHOO|nr:OB-fold domain-containing protein [Thauera sp. K11]ATE58754.1 hypothetical protein CCZ27_01205 [Thauera sp. K11]